MSGDQPLISPHLTTDGVTLLNSIIAKHGGAEALGTAGVEIALGIVKLHADARRTASPLERVRVMEAISRAYELLPDEVGPEATHLDLTLLDDGELDSLLQLVSKATAAGEGPAAAEVEDELTRLRRALEDARGYHARWEVEFEGRQEAIKARTRAEAEVYELKQEVAGLKRAIALVREGLSERNISKLHAAVGQDAPGSAVGASEPESGGRQPPAPENAPPQRRVQASGILRDDQLPLDCRPLLAPGQNGAAAVYAIPAPAGLGAGRFDNRG
jgi:hypothetical protein